MTDSKPTPIITAPPAPKPAKKKSVRAKRRHDFTGQKCAICEAPYTFGASFCDHHLDYDLNLTIPVCYRCHRTIHYGQRFNPFVARLKSEGFPENQAKTYGASIFAARLAEHFHDRIIVPLIEKAQRTAAERERRDGTTVTRSRKISTREH